MILKLIENFIDQYWTYNNYKRKKVGKFRLTTFLNVVQGKELYKLKYIFKKVANVNQKKMKWEIRYQLSFENKPNASFLYRKTNFTFDTLLFAH